jgi:hypothetical protein
MLDCAVLLTDVEMILRKDDEKIISAIEQEAPAQDWISRPYGECWRPQAAAAQAP